MRTKITKRAVDSVVAAPKPAYLWDTELKGFGLKVTPAGAKVYLVQYRMGGRDTPARRYTIGKHGSPWTSDAARGEAKRLLGCIAIGQDPQSERVQEKAERANQTVNTAVTLFLDRHAAQLRTAHEIRRIFEKEVLPRWGSRLITEVAKRDVLALLDAVVDSGRPIRSNRVFAAVRKFFN